ncbi:MAG: lipid II flippase MurJ [Pseudomonadales bacterium]
MTLLNLLIQSAGFVKLLLIAHLFGTSAVLDGYYLSLVVPTLVIGLLGGMLQTGFTPVYTALIADSKQNADRLFSDVFWLTTIVLAPVCLFLALTAYPVAALLTLTEDTAVLEATATSMRVIAIVMLANTLADFLALALNAHKRFFLSAASPLVNVVVSTLALVVGPLGDQRTLTYGLLAGVSAQLLILILGLHHGGTRLSLNWPRLTPELRRVLSLVSMIALGVLATNFNGAIDQIMASLLGEGAVSTIGYANRFHGLVVQILIIGVGTVLLPHVASMVAAGDSDSIRSVFGGIFLILAFICSAAALLVTVMAPPVLQWLLTNNQLDLQGIQSISRVWMWYTFGLFPMAWGIYLARYFQAARLPLILTRLALVSCIANVALNLLLIGPFGLEGLAMSTSLVYLITGIALSRHFSRALNFSFDTDRRRILMVILLTAFFIVVALGEFAEIPLSIEIATCFFMMLFAAHILSLIPTARALYSRHG